MTQTSDRVEWIDYAKGIAILLVVYTHVIGGNASDYTDPGMMLLFNINVCLHHAVLPLFFLLAGLHAKKWLTSDLRGFINAKVIRFGYIYTLWSVIRLSLVPTLFVLAVHQGQGFMDRLNLEGLSRMYIDLTPTLWFIYVLVLCFVLARVVSRAGMWAGDATAALMYISVYLLDVRQLPMQAQLLVFFPFFWLGIRCSGHIYRLAESAKPWMLMCLVVYVCLGCISPASRDSPPVYFRLPLQVTGIAGTIILCALLAHWQRARIVRLAGEHSLAIYISHFLPLMIALKLIPRTEMNIPICLTVWVLASLLPLLAFWVAQRIGLGWLYGPPAWLALPARKGRRPDDPCP